MANKYTFAQGDVVSIKGMAGEHRVGYCIMVSIPSIERFKFVMVEREMAKFTYGKEPFYAWTSDLKRVEVKGRKL